jgi:hypothetical protein
MTFCETEWLQSFRNAGVYEILRSEQKKDKRKKPYLRGGRINPVENIAKMRRGNVGSFQTDLSVLGFGMRLKFCTWSRHVWTLHEGAVAQKVMFRMANGLVSMSTMHHQMAKVKYPTRDENGWHILRTIEEEYVHALLQSCIMINKLAPAARSTFFLTWREVKMRATSLETDQYLVMGIINQVDERTLLQLQRSEMDRVDLGAARRAKLKSVLLSSSIIPQGIIFTPDKWFEESGVQQAPSAIGAEIPDDGSSISFEKIDGCHGNQVPY